MISKSLERRMDDLEKRMAKMEEKIDKIKARRPHEAVIPLKMEDGVIHISCESLAAIRRHDDLLSDDRLP